LAEKREKPVSGIVADLGINDNMPHRRIQQAREAQACRLFPDTDGLGIKSYPARGRTSRRRGRRCEAPLHGKS
jgi:hypothetical protein